MCRVFIAYPSTHIAFFFQSQTAYHFQSDPQGAEAEPSPDSQTQFYSTGLTSVLER